MTIRKDSTKRVTSTVMKSPKLFPRNPTCWDFFPSGWDFFPRRWDFWELSIFCRHVFPAAWGCCR